ncbi:hypothetical protein ZWY2020_014203 [Hordeum vulgare]|nr:hypothetical protein ZWY2020_014203 [Hordeum vulgare]
MPRSGRARAQLVSFAVAPSANPKVAERRVTPSRNALSAVFMCEEEGLQATSSGSDRDAERTRVDLELTRGEEATKKHHHLDLNTLRGHTDCITVLDFSTDACNLATGDPLLKAIRDTLLRPVKWHGGSPCSSSLASVVHRTGVDAMEARCSDRFFFSTTKRRLPTLPMLRSSRSGTLRVHGLEEQQQ